MDPARLDQPYPTSDGLPAEPLGVPYVWQPRPKFQDRLWVHRALFIITVLTTTAVGIANYLSFTSDFQPLSGVSLSLGLVLRGFFYSGTILAILGCHELGHYFACRYYDVDASRPFFIPFPFSITGTLGAFIKIREPIPSKRMLFDIGIAGPIAGFVIAVPALFLGIALSHVVAVPRDFVGIELGEPLLFKLASHLIWGSIPDGFSLNLHPMAFAAWFGLLATALNLFPMGQLDGGHISYTVLGQRSTYISYATIGGSMVLAFFYTSWIAWTVLMLLMVFAFGARHPRVFDEHVPLDRTRLILAIVALAMFVLCFTPAPIQATDLLR